MDSTIYLSSLDYRVCKKKKQGSSHMPELVVNINFGKGHMIMDGNWEYLLKSNSHNRDKWVNTVVSRVISETKFNSSSAITLTGDKELVFPLEGYLDNGQQTAGTSGLLILSKAPYGPQWNAEVYLFDYQFDACEIHFNIPLYVCEDEQVKYN